MNKHQLLRKLTGNPLIRILYYPVIKYKHFKTCKEYANSAFSQDILHFRNSHKGEKCYVVGNGPSLHIEDLEMLHSEGKLCFGMNHIFDLFDKTSWRPDYYFCFDRDFIRAEYQSILSLPVENIFIEYSKAPKKKVKKENVHYYLSDYVFAVKRGTAITDHVCTELHEVTSFVTNTTQLCIEFAIYMGFEEINLIGIDHDYSFGYGMNHAEGIKEGLHNDKKVFCTSDLDTSTKKYEQYRKYADEHGIKIYNATRGGKLQCFERKEFSK